MTTTQNNHPPLLRLAPELILRIIDFIDPASHLDFACTCKLLANYSTDVLHRHWEAYSQYRVASDLHPSTVINLLLSVCGMTEPLVAWHARSFEVWCDRTDREDWRPFKPTITPPHDFDRSVEPLVAGLDRDDLLQEYIKLLTHDEKVNAGEDASRARTEIIDGHDGFLKALLLSLLPRLQDVKFVWRGNRYASDSGFLAWFNKFIELSRRANSWHPGLQSIQTVAIDVKSGTHLDSQRPYRSPALLANLMFLPNIKSLFFGNLVMDQEDEHEEDPEDPDEKYGLDPGGSSVEALYLDEAYSLEEYFRKALLAAPLNLTSMAVRGAMGREFDDTDSILTELVEYHPGLKTLMFYQGEGLHGYRCHVYYPDELENLGSLRQVSVSVNDIDLACLSYDSEKTSIHDKFVDFFINCFPETAESIVVFDHPTGDYFCGEAKDYDGMSWVDDAVAALITSERLENLQAIFLDDLEGPRVRDALVTPPRDKPVFPKTLKAGREAGIDIHISANKSKVQRAVDMPCFPGAYDLVTGPNYRSKLEGDWRFDSYNGEWKPSCSGGCGDCQFCRLVYTREAWDAIRAQE